MKRSDRCLVARPLQSNGQSMLHVQCSIAPTPKFPTHRSRGLQENYETGSAVSPPASEAEFCSVYITDTAPMTSDWGCMNWTKWRVFDQDDAGVVLYPVQDACIDVMQKMAD